MTKRKKIAIISAITIALITLINGDNPSFRFPAGEPLGALVDDGNGPVCRPYGGYRSCSFFS